MKLEKAIEIQERKAKQNVFQVDPDTLDALKLLIEAGKRHQVRASLTYMDLMKPLPGETT